MPTTPEFLSATTLIGDDVKNHDNDSLGKLKDIMINTVDGTIAYGVVSGGGTLGIGKKLFAVPWSALSINGEHKNLILDVSKHRLKDAPGFDEDDWPDFADPSFMSNVDGYYAPPRTRSGQNEV